VEKGESLVIEFHLCLDTGVDELDAAALWRMGGG
jgi:hypothetical protein